MVLPSRKGYFYSMSQPNYCLRVSNIDTGSLELGNCDSNAKLEHTTEGIFHLIGNNENCIGLLNGKEINNTEINLSLNNCSKTIPTTLCGMFHIPTMVISILNLIINVVLWLRIMLP